MYVNLQYMNWGPDGGDYAGDKSGSEGGLKKMVSSARARTRTGTDATVLPWTLSHMG
jgi:hypothetical protein